MQLNANVLKVPYPLDIQFSLASSTHYSCIMWRTAKDTILA